MNKKFAIVDSENKDLVQSIKNLFPDSCEIITQNQDLSDYDLIVLTSFEKNENIKSDATILNIHPSLLPAFAEEDAIRQAFLAGVKVSGITIHKVKKENFYGEIIAQAPILIGNSTHFDELRTELIKLGIQVYPKVIKAILDDKVFDFSDLFSGGCSGGCAGGCNKCSH